MAWIKVENLCFSYEEGTPVLKDVSFSVKEGEHIALIGHNGSGKSTLAKILAGLLKPTSRNITMFGLPVEKKNLPAIRRQLGIVFQNPDNQFVASSVREDIAFGLENRAIPQQEMDPIILKFAKEVGMEGFLDAAPENLSGGQKQRVAIAGVLAMGPSLLLLDEATSMLDPKGKAEILSLIEQMRANNEKLTIFSITHDVEEAAKADWVLVLHNGELVLQGKPEDVFAHKEELAAIRLEAPFYLRLMDALKEEGIDLPSSIHNLSELEDYLCR